MLKRIHHLLAKHKNFAFETTLSAKSYLGFIKRAKKNGYNVALIYLWLNSFDIAKQRVAKRVSEGGHNIPEDVIERRYYRGLKNLGIFFDIVDDWFCFDNSNGEYELIAKKSGDGKTIVNFEIWKQIQT